MIGIPRFIFQKTNKYFLVISIGLFSKLPKTIIESNKIQFLI